MEKSIYKSKISALIIYIIAEALMIIFPDNLYLCGSFFLLGHIVLIIPFIKYTINQDFIWYITAYVISICLMFIFKGNTKTSFVIGFTIYLFILMMLAYQTRKESLLFINSTHLLFVSDIFLGLNIISIHNCYLIPVYGTLFFSGIILLVIEIYKERKYDKMLIRKIQ